MKEKSCGLCGENRGIYTATYKAKTIIFCDSCIEDYVQKDENGYFFYLEGQRWEVEF